MNILLNTFVVINTMLAILYAIGHYFVLKFVKNPKIKAAFGVILVTFFTLYLILILGISLYSLYTCNFKFLPLTIFMIIPFIIGKKANYKTLSFWSNLQLSAFVASLIICSFIVCGKV